MALYGVLSARVYSCSRRDTTPRSRIGVMLLRGERRREFLEHAIARRRRGANHPWARRRRHDPKTSITGMISWMVLHKWGRGSGEGEGETRFGCGCRPKTERTRKGAGRLPAATHKNTNRCSRAGPQRRTPTPRAASLACLVRALTARTSSTSMAGFWWSRPSAPRMTCARRFSRKPPAVATGPPSTSARS